MSKKKKKPDKPKKKKVTKSKKGINPKQEEFCQLFASDKEFFGNGTLAYIEAYNIDLTQKGAYDGAKANAYKLLTKTYILERINKIFETRGLNDTFVDKQLEKLITQDADFKSKINAIREYNALKGRILKKVDLTSKGKKIKNAPITNQITLTNFKDEPDSQ